MAIERSRTETMRDFTARAHAGGQQLPGSFVAGGDLRTFLGHGAFAVWCCRGRWGVVAVRARATARF